MKKILAFVVFQCILVCADAQTSVTDVILNRYKEFLFQTDSSLSTFHKVPSINKDGRWDDINYYDNLPGVWQLSTHMRRIKTLALYWSYPSSTYYHNAAVKNTILLALDDWFKHHYRSKNWWHNEIGIPQLMRDVIILMRDSLTGEQLDQCLKILRQHKVNGTGANLVWSADLGLHYGALVNDTAMMRHCRDTILSVIRISTDEGVQPDYSFHQHGKRLQMYHYGGAFLLDDVRLAWQLHGTALAFPAAQTKVLTDFVLKGWQWMARGINTVPGTIDRAASRVDALHSADIRKIIPYLCAIEPDSSRAFKNMLQIQEGRGTLIGYRYFPYSDFTSFQQPGYSFFLKTNSNRTLLTESINEENLKGALLDGGDGYFISNGNEYYNLMPFWDWEALPGITNYKSEGRNRIHSQAFVGNVSNGNSGLAVMDYALKNEDQYLSAKKFWASWKGYTVALVAGINTTNISAPVFTVMDQCRWQGRVSANKKGQAMCEGIHGFSHLKWIHHGNFVYMPLAGDSVTLELKTVKARWTDINHSEPSALLEDKVFKASLIHKKSSSGYVVAYAPTVEKAAQIALHPVWQVLRNDSMCQAVSFGTGVLMVALYKPGEIKLKNGMHIRVSQPCLLLQKGPHVFVSDPAHMGGQLQVSLNQKKYTALLPDDGSTVELMK